ncbi:uncharacterized protein AKAME5_000988500 [Lates japonicus]|uniref:Uncharacterized protein n=1 Tax=Lates japonicus TaxID=270547 RepID=A0AAD3MMF1_LATJO|nr:uncharacterized protein AKAME5_000988500 [Lates japonicus]
MSQPLMLTNSADNQEPGRTSAFEHGSEGLTHFGSRLDPYTQHERPITKEVYKSCHFLDVIVSWKKTKGPTVLQRL